MLCAHCMHYRIFGVVRYAFSVVAGAKSRTYASLGCGRRYDARSTFSNISCAVPALPCAPSRRAARTRSIRQVRSKATTPRGFEPLRAEPNGFLVHLLSHSDTVSCHGLRAWVRSLIFSTLVFPKACLLQRRPLRGSFVNLVSWFSITRWSIIRPRAKGFLFSRAAKWSHAGLNRGPYGY